MSETFVVLSAVRTDGAPHGILVHESEYEGDPADWFVPGTVQEGTPRHEGTVQVAGAAALKMETHYEAVR